MGELHPGEGEEQERAFAAERWPGRTVVRGARTRGERIEDGDEPAATAALVYAKRDPRMKCGLCRRWMRLRPTRATPLRRLSKDSGRCVECNERRDQ